MATEGRPGLDDAAMFMAMWMHKHPLVEAPERAVENKKTPKTYNKMGVVVKNADGYLFAAEFSRKYAHPVMSLILKFGRRLEGSTLYASRKPCSDCTKHMIQVRIKHVYYFPCDPEAGNPTNPKAKKESNEPEGDLEISDYLFKLSDTSVRIKIPSYKSDIPVNEDSTRTDDATPRDNLKPFGKLQCESEYVVSHQALRCAINTSDREEVPVKELKRRMKKKYREAIRKLNAMEGQHRSEIPPTAITPGTSLPFPDLEETRDDLFHHGFVMANIISYRKSDPTTGVGAALMDSKGHYIGFGYNGYPWGVSHDDVPKSKTDPIASNLKYAYMIHAETNALIFCNKIGIDHEKENTVLFSTKEPCNHCAFNIFESGVKTVVYGEKRENEDGKKISPIVKRAAIAYEKFTNYAEKEDFNLFKLETCDDTEPPKKRRSDRLARKKT